jgi:hypothetical protein
VNFAELRAMALHDRATVAYRRGEFERAVRLGYEALENTSSPVERDRVLADIATAFVELGVRTAARDALLVLAATAQEQYARWSATINLLNVAVADRAEPVFEQYRRELADAALPPFLRAEYHLHVGRGHWMFGDAAAAHGELTKAVQIASQHELHQLAFLAEQALAQLGRSERASGGRAVEAPASVRHVADALHEMREMIGAGG